MINASWKTLFLYDYRLFRLNDFYSYSWRIFFLLLLFLSISKWIVLDVTVWKTVIIQNENEDYLRVMALNLNEHDVHDYDVDLDSDMWDCCYFSEYPHLVLTSVMHGRAPNPMSIYY